ncbi:hypothetical protein F5148DRAFT_1241642 [Russula earlei]|uniref:Uncharacterized protein n=1 Tax=Russula earlei TaxID=71964 RepID=A0ACC0TW64_9AGAM|nr:hypothetical protein F5148DRAFT_1241642 [Russula earlei]
MRTSSIFVMFCLASGVAPSPARPDDHPLSFDFPRKSLLTPEKLRQLRKKREALILKTKNPEFPSEERKLALQRIDSIYTMIEDHDHAECILRMDSRQKDGGPKAWSLGHSRD